MIDSARHWSVFDPTNWKDKNTPIHVIGAGATGSKIAMSLAKLGVTDIHVWDDDVVESHNIANQFYGLADIGKPKVQALAEHIESFCGTTITTHQEKVADQALEGVVFLLTDTMSSRKEIFDNCLKAKRRVQFVVETRMGADNGRVYSFDPRVKREYETWEGTLYGDDEAEVSACGATVSVGPTAEIISGWAIWEFIRWSSESDKNEHEVIFAVRDSMVLVQNWRD